MPITNENLKKKVFNEKIFAKSFISAMFNSVFRIDQTYNIEIKIENM